MKKLFRLGLALALPVAAILVIVYKVVNQAPSPDLPQYEQVLQILDEGGCISCHSADPKVPFYAKMPVAGKIVMKDIDSGYRAYDITKFMEELKVDGDVSPVDLAKIEKVVLDDRMPMPKYYLVHWGSSLTQAKRNIVLDWIHARRVAMYNDALPEDRAGEPVRPIDEYVAYDPAKAALGFDLFHDSFNLFKFQIDDVVHDSLCLVHMLLEQLVVEICFRSEWVYHVREEVYSNKSA
jgi:cytochrome c peroxidase